MATAKSLLVKIAATAKNNATLIGESIMFTNKQYHQYSLLVALPRGSKKLERPTLIDSVNDIEN